MKLYKEEFKNLNHLLNELNSRPNCDAMRGENSSSSGSESFTGTRNWEEAITLLRNGYTEILPKIREGMKKNAKVYNEYMALPKSIPQNLPIGYVPNVLNSIMNLPNSMISIERKPQKRKTMSILYSIGGAACEDQEFFIKAGITLLTAINIVETKGVQTKLTLCFMPARECDDEAIFPTVVLKNYGQKYDLQKLCFPLANASMFRRIGFKYLETCPYIKNRGWSFGYGQPLWRDKEIEPFKKELHIDDINSFFMNNYWIREHNYDVLKLLDYFKITKKED